MHIGLAQSTDPGLNEGTSLPALQLAALHKQCHSQYLLCFSLCFYLGSPDGACMQMQVVEADTREGINICLTIISVKQILVKQASNEVMRCCVGLQVQEADLHRVATATGAQVQTTVNNLSPRVLGTCEAFEEKQVMMSNTAVLMYSNAPSCMLEMMLLLCTPASLTQASTF